MASNPRLSYQIVNMRAEDWPAVEKIYRQGIATENATFETESPDWENWNAKHHVHSRLVARNEQRVLGWAALSPVSARRVYAGVAEVSIYIVEVARGKGVGKGLLSALIEQSEEHGIWTLQGGTFPENVASLRLQERCGFRVIGRRERIGRHHGVWRDTVLTERRSSRVGVD